MKKPAKDASREPIDNHSMNGAAWLRAMIEASVDCVITIDAQSTIIEFNAAAERTFGYRRDDVIGKPLTETIIPPSLREGHRRGMAALLKGGTSKLLGRRVEMPAMRSDGSEFPVELTVTQIAGQTPPIFTAYLRDITDRVQAEEALNAQALRYKTLMETSTDSIYVLDEKGDLQEANAAFLRRRGYAAEEVKGLNVTDWDTRLGRDQLPERMRKLVDGNAVFETRHRCKDGSVFDVEVCATGVRIGGEQLIFCVARDISERKQAEDRLRRSEEKFKTLFGIAPVGISVLDQQLNVIDANPALEQILRLAKEELLNGTHRRRTYLNADGTPKSPGALASVRAITENRPINNVETGIVTENGEVIWTQVSAAPLDLPEASAVVITQDITERKRAAKELEEANRQLRILSGQLFHIQEEERRHLARELHDEIGQSLTAAKINLKIIAPEVPAHATGRLDDSVELLDRLLRQVRQLSLDLHPSLLDDLGLAPALRSLLDQQAHRAGLRAQFYASESFETLDSGIQIAGFRIAQEAITNVLKHAKAQFVGVHLRTDEGELQMKIVDDGKGFDVAEVGRRAHNGAGSGLMGMRERAALVGGHVQIISSPGKGTTVEVSLPLDASGEIPK